MLLAGMREGSATSWLPCPRDAEVCSHLPVERLLLLQSWGHLCGARIIAGERVCTRKS